jgi:pyruvate kinase
MGFRRATKIICTIGPASASDAGLAALAEAGMDVARLNFSHGERAEHGRVLDSVRALATRRGTPIAVLMDLAGPKVRIGEFPDGHVTLEAGDRFTLTTRPVEGSRTGVSLSYAGLPAEVEPGHSLLLADGAVELKVVAVGDDEIQCEVVTGGRLGSRKGVNVPSGLSKLPILSDRDLEDLRFGVARRVDYVGLSFVRRRRTFARRAATSRRSAPRRRSSPRSRRRRRCATSTRSWRWPTA